MMKKIIALDTCVEEGVFVGFGKKPTLSEALCLQEAHEVYFAQCRRYLPLPWYEKFGVEKEMLSHVYPIANLNGAFLEFLAPGSPKKMIIAFDVTGRGHGATLRKKGDHSLWYDTIVGDQVIRNFHDVQLSIRSIEITMKASVLRFEMVWYLLTPGDEEIYSSN